MSKRSGLMSILSLAMALWGTDQRCFADSLQIICPVASFPLNAYNNTTPAIIAWHNAPDEMTVTTWACSDMDEMLNQNSATEGTVNSVAKTYHKCLFDAVGSSTTKVWTAYAFGQKTDDTYECAIAVDFKLTSAGGTCPQPVIVAKKNYGRAVRFENSDRFQDVDPSLKGGKVLQIDGKYSGTARKVHCIIIRKHGKKLTQLKSSGALPGTGVRNFTINAGTPIAAPGTGIYYVILFAGNDRYIFSKDINQ